MIREMLRKADALSSPRRTVEKDVVILILHVFQHGIHRRRKDGLPCIILRRRQEIQMVIHFQDDILRKAAAFRQIHHMIEALIFQPQHEIHISHAHIPIDEEHLLPLPGEEDPQSSSEERLPHAALTGSKGYDLSHSFCLLPLPHPLPSALPANNLRYGNRHPSSS